MAIAELIIEDLVKGRSFSFEVTVAENDVDLFAQLSGDFNPLHMDRTFARERTFEKRVVHGVLLASYLSRMVGMHCPGKDALLQSMNLKFLSPVYVGDTVRVHAVVDQVSPSVSTALLKVTVENSTANRISVRGSIQVGFTKGR